MKYNLAILATVFIVTLILIIPWPKPEQPKEKPSIYILSLNKYKDYEEKETWVLQFFVDGRIEHANFTKSGDCAAFLEYLGTIGVIHGGAE